MVEATQIPDSLDPFATLSLCATDSQGRAFNIPHQRVGI